MTGQHLTVTVQGGSDNGMRADAPCRPARRGAARPGPGLGGYRSTRRVGAAARSSDIRSATARSRARAGGTGPLSAEM